MSYPPTPPTDPYRPAGEEPEGTGQQGPVPPAYPGYPQQSPSPYGAPTPGTPDSGYPQYGAPAPQPPYGAPQQPYGAPGQPPYGATPYGATPYAGAPVPGGAYGYFPRNDLGIWAFVLGIASIVLSCGFFTGIPAIIVGSKAKRAVAAGEANNGGLALAGVILGWVGIALSIIGVIFLIAIIASPDFQAGFREGYYG